MQCVQSLEDLIDPLDSRAELGRPRRSDTSATQGVRVSVSMLVKMTL